MHAPTFKGIALFTPGGDLVYGIDPKKQEHWHVHLCTALQDHLKLPEPPHFLVPCFSATVDCWIDPATQELHMVAEAKPALRRYQPILSALFGLHQSTHWQILDWEEHWCDPQVLASYQSEFPQLWQNHNLVIQVDRPSPVALMSTPHVTPPRTLPTGYVLRLYVAGINPTTERTLQSLHQCLESSVKIPYTLEMIDVLRHPDKAEADQIRATPTLIKVWPPPIRRIVGTLDPVETILPFLSVAPEEFELEP